MSNAHRHGDGWNVCMIIAVLGVAAEKQQQGFVQGIENFNKEKLSHAETDEKNPLPDKSSM